MRNRAELYLLDQKAKRYGQRPATLLGLDPQHDPLLANSIDNAAYLWGTWIDGMLSETDEKGKPKYRLPVLLDDRPPSARPLTSLYEAVKGRAKSK